MKEPGAKRWVWDLYPLSAGTWGNRQVPADDTPPGQRMKTSRKRASGRVSYMFSDKPSHPLRVETVWRWAYVPTEDNLAALIRWYPGDAPGCPSWDTIKSELVVASHVAAELDKMEAPVLLAMLGAIRNAKADQAGNTASASSGTKTRDDIEPRCRRLCAELREEITTLDASPLPMDAPRPQHCAWIEAVAGLLADVHGERLARADRFRDQLVAMKHASRSSKLSPVEKREHQRMAKGLLEVLALAERSVSVSETWRADLWERTKVFLPGVAKCISVVCAGTGHFPADKIDAAVKEWRQIEVAAAEKRAAAGEKKWNLAAGTWDAAERAAWRPHSETDDQAIEEDNTVARRERRSLSAEDEADLLQRCLRRCCLCYALEGDDSQKEGQIAHLDHNRSNGQPDNFVFLCLRHHNSYDSKMGQAKNITEQEVRRHRQTLLDAIEEGKVPARRESAVLKFPTPGPSAVNVNGDGNVVAGGDVNYVVNMPKPTRRKGRSSSKPPIIPGTVSEDARMVGYLNYLVRRYEQFKKWECDRNGQRMGWGVIRNAYKREMKYEVIHTPKEMFEDAVEYLQRRIRNTRLGRMKKCQRFYSEFKEFDEKTSGKERLPVDD